MLVPTAEGRLAIAKKILAGADRYGVAHRDIVFDPLAMAVSAMPDAARVTLESIRLIRRETGCRVVLGVSNVSFGLPRRSDLNATFFTLAMQQGLSAAIMNPHSPEMLTAYHTFLALNELDPNFEGYVSYMQNAEPKQNASAPENDTLSLRTIVERGLRPKAAETTRSLLQTTSGMELIETQIIPALNAVGEDFENKKLFLPQLLNSAETAAEAFEVIKAASKTNDDTPVRCKIVLLTVRGDIHDIGKNIVKLLLQNFGFRVIDLGKDVPPEAVVRAVLEENAPIVGLSALMTTTVPAMRETILALRAAAPKCRIIVGGAVLTPDYAKAIGADHYAADAMESVKIASMLDDELKKENPV